MSWVDLALVILLCAFMANGYYQGFVRQVASFLGFILGFGLAFTLYRVIGNWLAPSAALQATTEAIVFVVILFSVWIVSNLLGFGARERLRSRPSDKRSNDDIGGALLGLLTGILVVAILVYGIAHLGIPPADEIRESFIGAWLLETIANVGPILLP